MDREMSFFSLVFVLPKKKDLVTKKRKSRIVCGLTKQALVLVRGATAARAAAVSVAVTVEDSVGFWNWLRRWRVSKVQLGPETAETLGAIFHTEESAGG